MLLIHRNTALCRITRKRHTQQTKHWRRVDLGCTQTVHFNPTIYLWTEIFHGQNLTASICLNVKSVLDKHCSVSSSINQIIFRLMFEANSQKKKINRLETALKYFYVIECTKTSDPL